MSTIDSIEALEALYGQPKPAAVAKVVTRHTPMYAKWIETAQFLILSTVWRY